MRIINFDDGFTSTTSPATEMLASTVSVTPAGNLVSTNVQAALVELQGDADTATTHIANVSNPHAVTKTQVGLSNVTNDAQIPLAQKGAVSGVAELDSGGKVPTAQLPDAVVGSVKYKGAWNALTNSPALVTSTGTMGDYYVVSSAGTTTLDLVSEWAIGDWAIFNGSAWQKIDNTDAVTLDTAQTFTNKTFTAPIINGGLVGTSLDFKATAEARFYDADNSHYVGFEAPALSANKIWVLPDADGGANQVLKTDGSGNLGWAATAATVTTTRGDLIARGAVADDRLPIGTANQVLKTDGTDPAWGAIVNANIDAAAAIAGTKIVSASGATSGVVTGTTQTFGGVKTFTDGIAFANETLSTYDEGTWAITTASASANFNAGSGTTLSNARYRQIGKIVFVCVNTISGSVAFNINAAGNPSYFQLEGITGLPSFTSKIAIGGSAQWLIGTTYLSCAIVADTISSSNVLMQLTTTATGNWVASGVSFFYVLP